MFEKDLEIYKWVYKPGYSSYGGEKIYLFFDQNDELVDWEHRNVAGTS